MTVSDSVKNRTDRRPPVRPEFVSSSPALRPASSPSSRARAPVSKKIIKVKKQQTKRVSTTTRKKTVTRREKASDRSLDGPPAGSVLRRKVLAAVLLHRFAEQSDSKGKGKARKAQPDGRTSHPAVFKYVLESVGSEAGPSATAVKVQVAAARKALVEQGFLVSSKKGVLLTAAAADTIDGLEEDEDVDAVAAECLAHFYDDKSVTSEVQGDSVDAAPAATQKRSGRRAIDYQEPSESEGDEDEDEMVENASAPKATASRQRKTVVTPPRSAAPPAKRQTSASNLLAKLKKADLISRVKTLEQALSAAQQHADSPVEEDEGDDDAEDLRRKLWEISVANQQWRKKALDLRNRLAQHVDPATIDFDERDAYGLNAPDTGELDDGDGGGVDLGGMDQQMFDDFVNPDAAATGPAQSSGSDDLEFPELDLEDHSRAQGPNVTPSSSVKGKGKQVDHRAQSPSGPAHSSSTWNHGGFGSSTTSGPAASTPSTSPLQKSRHLSGSGGAPPLLGGGAQSDDLSPAGIARERSRADSYKEELELVQRAHHEEIRELTNVAHELEARLAASERRLVAYQAAAVASALAKEAASPCEHEERLREHHAALADVLKRYEALEGELAARTATIEQQRLELASSAADYEGLLAREGRLKQDLHSSSRRITEFEAQLEAYKTDTATSSATAKRNKDLEQELGASRIGAAKLKTSLSHFEAELEKSSKELEAATSECRDLQHKLDNSLRDKERETEALDNSMEQRRVLELELARLREDLAAVKKRSDEASAQYQTRARADQETITTLTQELSDLLLEVEDLETLEPTAERAEQYRADIAALQRELKDSETRYEQVQNARHAEESVLRARDAQILELLQTNERLHLDLLDSEAQAERANSRVNELERLHAQLSAELADGKTTLDNLLAQLHSALQDPDAVPFASSEQDAAAVVSAVRTLRRKWEEVHATAADQLCLLKSVRSYARDILAVLPVATPLSSDADVEAILAAVLREVCGALGVAAEAQSQLDEARTELAGTAEVLSGLVTTLSASTGFDTVTTPGANNADILLASKVQAKCLADAVASKVEALTREYSEIRHQCETEQQTIEEHIGEITTLRVELSKARSYRDQLEARLASIRELVNTTD